MSIDLQTTIPVQVYNERDESFIKGIDVVTPLIIKKRFKIPLKGKRTLYVEVRDLHLASDGSTDARVKILAELD